MMLAPLFYEANDEITSRRCTPGGEMGTSFDCLAFFRDHLPDRVPHTQAAAGPLAFWWFDFFCKDTNKYETPLIECG